MAPQRNNIWFHFEVLIEKVSAKCQYCKQVSFTKSGSMGNLNRHMKTKHPGINIARGSTASSTNSQPAEPRAGPSSCSSSSSQVSETKQIEDGDGASVSASNASTSVNTGVSSSSVSLKGEKANIQSFQSDISNFAYVKKP